MFLLTLNVLHCLWRRYVYYLAWKYIFSLPLYVDNMFICHSNFLILQIVAYFEVDQPSKVTFACGHVIVLITSQVQLHTSFSSLLNYWHKAVVCSVWSGGHLSAVSIISRILWFLGSFKVHNIAVMGEADIRSSFISFYSNTVYVLAEEVYLLSYSMLTYSGIPSWGAKALTQESIYA